MTTNSWQIKVDASSAQEVNKWLAEETSKSFEIVSQNSEIVLDFHGIDDAFRFRMRFDEILVQ